MSAFIITRINVGDYERWRPMFDQDLPGAREKATVQRVLRSVDDAEEGRDRLVSSGVLDRFEDKHGPNVLVDADD